MRSTLAALFTLGMVASPLAAPAFADVTITTPGVTVERAPGPYWRHDGDWRAQRDWAGNNEYGRPAWQHEHCVRDWQGQTYCR